MSEFKANLDLSDTARMKGLDALRHDPLEDTQRMTPTEKRNANHNALAAHTAHLVVVDVLRERRKAATVGARAPETHRLDTVSERDQSAIESGTWPVYTP